MERVVADGVNDVKANAQYFHDNCIKGSIKIKKNSTDRELSSIIESL